MSHSFLGQAATVSTALPQTSAKGGLVAVEIGRVSSSPIRLFGNRQSRFRSEGGHATGRCYSFLKPSPTARRAWPRPTLGPAVDYEISWEPGQMGDPCPHVSISVDASHPTGRRKVPSTRRTELVGVVSKAVCPGALCRHGPVECLPSNVARE